MHSPTLDSTVLISVVRCVAFCVCGTNCAGLSLNTVHECKVFVSLKHSFHFSIDSTWNEAYRINVHVVFAIRYISVSNCTTTDLVRKTGLSLGWLQKIFSEFLTTNYVRNNHVGLFSFEEKKYRTGFNSRK